MEIHHHSFLFTNRHDFLSHSYPASVCTSRKCPRLGYMSHFRPVVQGCKNTEGVFLVWNTHCQPFLVQYPWMNHLVGVCVSWNQNEGVLIMDIEQQCVRRQKAAVCHHSVSVMYFRSAGQTDNRAAMTFKAGMAGAGHPARILARLTKTL